jgi:hypothetical protein
MLYRRIDAREFLPFVVHTVDETWTWIPDRRRVRREAR